MELFPPLTFSMLADEGGPLKKARRTSPYSAPALGAALDRVDAAYVAQQAQVAGNFLVVHDVLNAVVCETVLQDVLALHQPQVASFSASDFAWLFFSASSASGVPECRAFSLIFLTIFWRTSTAAQELVYEGNGDGGTSYTNSWRISTYAHTSPETYVYQVFKEKYGSPYDTTLRQYMQSEGLLEMLETLKSTFLTTLGRASGHADATIQVLQYNGLGVETHELTQKLSYHTLTFTHSKHTHTS